VHFKDSKGNLLKTVEANEGDDLLTIAHEYDIDLEGACEGSVACSTCHVILTPEYYDKLPEPSDDENDMLDMAFGLTDTSRLGCQVQLTKELDGMSATLPSATRNMFVDGKKTHKALIHAERLPFVSFPHALCVSKTPKASTAAIRNAIE